MNRARFHFEAFIAGQRCSNLAYDAGEAAKKLGEQAGCVVEVKADDHCSSAAIVMLRFPVREITGGADVLRDDGPTGSWSLQMISAA